MFKVGDIVRLKDNARNDRTPFWRVAEKYNKHVDYDHLKITRLEPRDHGEWLCVFGPQYCFGIMSGCIEPSYGGPW